MSNLADLKKLSSKTSGKLNEKNIHNRSNTEKEITDVGNSMYSNFTKQFKKTPKYEKKTFTINKKTIARMEMLKKTDVIESYSDFVNKALEFALDLLENDN